MTPVAVGAAFGAGIAIGWIAFELGAGTWILDQATRLVVIR